MTTNLAGTGLTNILLRIIRRQGRKILKTVWKTRALQYSMIQTRRKRQQILKKEGIHVPMGIGISPTAQCNLSCTGCYSRFHKKDEELNPDIISSTIQSAAEVGVFLFVITGGEPYMRSELIDIYKRFRRSLFITVTNGTYINEHIASEIARSGNIFPIVSIEGTEKQTDSRRGNGMYKKVIQCMNILKKNDVPFGFSSLVTNETITTLGSLEFIENMINCGCTVGFFNELIPLTDEEKSFLPSDIQNRQFKENLASYKNSEAIMLLYLPYDEYDKNGRCMSVGSGAFHINAQGFVEPCPFAHYARENIKHNTFREILQSPFLQAIRSHPAALRHGTIGCSLVNNLDILRDIAKKTGAVSTVSSRESIKMTF